MTGVEELEANYPSLEEWEDVLFREVADEVAQDALNDAVRDLMARYIKALSKQFGKYARLEERYRMMREFAAKIWPVVEHPARWCERCEYYDKCIGNDEDGSRYRVGCRWREDRRAEARELGILEDA